MQATPSALETIPDAPITAGRSGVRRILGVLGHPLILLLYLTIIGGLLRFVRLDQPPAWVDESMTYARASSTIPEMLKSLEGQAFPPLHYLAMWQIGQWHPLSVATMRFYPAVCGTLMIPAMYFLTRQMLSRRHALLVALFTTCSAWLINHSRDAKMYMPLWLFVALNAACFLWWIRSRTWTAWLCWIATGCAAVGLHGLGFVVLGLQPLWLLTSRHVKWSQGVWFVIGLMIISAGPIGYYQSKTRTREHGIEWVERRNHGHDALELTGDTLSALLFKYSWIQEWDEGIIPQQIVRGASWTFMVIGTLCILGVMPWKRSTVPIWLRLRDTLHRIPIEKLRAYLGDPPEIISRPRLVETHPEPWWRAALWVGMWIIVPLYGVYLASVDRAMTPVDWWRSFVGILRPDSPAASAHSPTLWFFGIASILAILLMMHVWVRRAAVLIAVGVPAGLWLYAMRTKLGFVDPERAGQYWLELLLHQRTVWIVGTLTIAVCWHYSAPTLRRRAIRLAQFGLAVGIMIGVLWGMSAAMKGTADGSVWMPRYLGIIWPGVAIAVVVLLSRLPTQPLRWVAIVALLGLNLAQAWARVYVPNDPPLDQVARDVIDGDKRDSHQLTFVANPPVGQGGPGMGRINGIGGRMYLFQLSGQKPLTPSDVFAGNREIVDVRLSTSVNRISRDLASRPDVTRVVIWEAYRPVAPNSPPKPPGPEWTLTDTDVYGVRVHWSWGRIYDYVRREYVKAPTTQPTALTN